MLEEVRIENGGDVYPINLIDELDLSNNPNIRKVFANVVPKINLNNGNNNFNMYLNIFCSACQNPNPDEIEGNVCIVVDNPMAAYNNEYPYSEWVIFHTNMSYSFGDSFENCSLSTPSNSIANVRVYPNPATDMVYIDPANTTVLKIVLFDISERIVLETSDSNKINITTLQSSTYLLKAHTNAGVYTQKIIVN